MKKFPGWILLTLGLGCASLSKFSDPYQNLSPSKGLKPLFTVESSQIPRGFSEPSAVAVDGSGNIYIADTNHDRIVKLSPEGKFAKEMGGFGFGPGQFSHPTGLSVERGLNLYVADSQNKRAQLFDLNLNFVASIQPAETLDFHGLGTTYDVALSPTGDFYVSDTWNDCVVELDNFYAYKSKVGSFEAGQGKLTNPQGLTVDAHGNLYVADQGSGRVCVYDDFGTFDKLIGAGALSGPADLAVLGNEIYICDQTQSQILCYSLKGELLWKQGTPGVLKGELGTPAGVAATPFRLYVIEKGNDRLQVFEIIR